MIPSDETHSFYDGVCTQCGIHQGEKRLIYNSQRVAHYVKAKHDYRNSDGTWPSAPQGWNTPGFNDQEWLDLPMGTANPGHTNGPRYSLRYNSFWFDEYNCYWMRFPIILTEIANDATFTFNCVHDDNMVVYVNEQEVINIEGWTPTQDNWESSHESFNIPASAFCQGKNIVSVYIQQNWGGAYFDCELRMKTASSVPGDVNGDGEVTGSDVTALYNHILFGQDTEIFNGDQNGDGEVTGSDVTAVYNIILGL